MTMWWVMKLLFPVSSRSLGSSLRPDTIMKWRWFHSEGKCAVAKRTHQHMETLHLKRKQLAPCIHRQRHVRSLAHTHAHKTADTFISSFWQRKEKRRIEKQDQTNHFFKDFLPSRVLAATRPVHGGERPTKKRLPEPFAPHRHTWFSLDSQGAVWSSLRAERETVLIVVNRFYVGALSYSSSAVAPLEGGRAQSAVHSAAVKHSTVTSSQYHARTHTQSTRAHKHIKYIYIKYRQTHNSNSPYFKRSTIWIS